MFQLFIGSSIFVSAFLMFFVQPLLAKHMLPQFGGSGFVWVTSILFFQTGLLLGYLWSYFLVKIPSQRIQAFIHLVLLGISFFYIPVQLDSVATLTQQWPPLNVLKLLNSTILIPFIVISASSPLLQHWYCRVKDTKFPYYFYSISNAGSLLGLLGYPFFIEPLFGLKQQALLWTALYLVYILLCILCMLKIIQTKSLHAATSNHISVSSHDIVKWVFLTFLSSAFLLAITQFLSQNVINLPLMWVAPLGLYLISFIVTFANSKSYDRFFWVGSFLIWLALILWLIYQQTLVGYDVVLVLLALLYCACMICHGELIRLKPAHLGALTTFYLFIALGGVLGGLFANSVAFILLGKWWDFYIPLFLIASMAITICYRHLGKITFMISCVLGFALIIIFTIDMYFPRTKLVAEKRNIYSYIRVYDFISADANLSFRQLRHGNTMHGLEFLEKSRQMWPTSYFGNNSGAALAIHYLQSKLQRPIHVAIIGLGCGTIALHAHKRDNFDFYEIDNDMKNIAYEYFSFLNNSSGNIKVYLGDARMELTQLYANTTAKKYDLIIADAFNGDAVPVHLLTVEAVNLYHKLLTPDGMIVFNTSNTFLNFMPLTVALAKQQDMDHIWIKSFADLNKGIVESNWAILTSDPKFNNFLKHQNGFQEISSKEIKPILWSDDFNSILPLLKINAFANQKRK